MLCSVNFIGRRGTEKRFCQFIPPADIETNHQVQTYRSLKQHLEIEVSEIKQQSNQ